MNPNSIIQKLWLTIAILALMFVVVVLTWIVAEVVFEAVIRILEKFEKRK